MTKEEIQKNSEHWYNKYKELEQKLAYLKEINAILSESSAINQKDLEYKVSVIKQRNKRFEELEKENAELKDLIKNIIRVTWGEGWNYSLDWKVKAEQFLNSVVEK